MEKVTACWQSNMDYSLEVCHSPKMCPPPPKRQLLKIQWIKAFFFLGVQIRMLKIRTLKIKPSERCQLLSISTHFKQK